MSNKQKALELAKGSYQKDLINGYETLGGSTLRGKARSYAGRYRESGRNLMNRLQENNIPYHVELGPRGGYHSAVLVIED